MTTGALWDKSRSCGLEMGRRSESTIRDCSVCVQARQEEEEKEDVAVEETCPYSAVDSAVW